MKRRGYLAAAECNGHGFRRSPGLSLPKNCEAAKKLVIEAADDKLAIGDDNNGQFICLICDTNVANVVPIFLNRARRDGTGDRRDRQQRRATNVAKVARLGLLHARRGDTPASLTQDVESIALGAGYSMLRVLFGLLRLAASVNE